MITFRVVKEQYGWSVRMDDCMTTPFRTRELAIREAECLARELHAHGQRAAVLVEEAAAQDVPRACMAPAPTGVFVSAS